MARSRSTRNLVSKRRAEAYRRERMATGLQGVESLEKRSMMAVDVLSGSLVYSTNGASDVVGAPLLDAGGRLIGLTGATPRFPQPGAPRAFGTPIERVWPFLKDHLPDLKPCDPPEAAKAWEKIVGESLRHLVTVISRPRP